MNANTMTPAEAIFTNLLKKAEVPAKDEARKSRQEIIGAAYDRLEELNDQGDFDTLELLDGLYNALKEFEKRGCRPVGSDSIISAEMIKVEQISNSLDLDPVSWYKNNIRKLKAGQIPLFTDEELIGLDNSDEVTKKLLITHLMFRCAGMFYVTKPKKRLDSFLGIKLALHPVVGRPGVLKATFSFNQKTTSDLERFASTKFVSGLREFVIRNFPEFDADKVMTASAKIRSTTEVLGFVLNPEVFNQSFLWMLFPSSLIPKTYTSEQWSSMSKEAKVSESKYLDMELRSWLREAELDYDLQPTFGGRTAYTAMKLYEELVSTDAYLGKVDNPFVSHIEEIVEDESVYESPEVFTEEASLPK